MNRNRESRRAPLYWVALFAGILAAGTTNVRANSIWVTSVVRDCAFADDDTVRIDVILSNAGAPLDDGSIGVSFSTLELEFVYGERGTLVADWTGFNATAAFGTVTLQMSNADAIPAQSSGQLARLTFVSDCCSHPHPKSDVCPWAGTGDFSSLSYVCGSFYCAGTALPGSISVSSGFQECDGTVDTVSVDVRLENTPGPIDAGGVDVYWFPYGALLTGVGYERGDLTAAWPTFDVVYFPGGRFRFSGSTPVAIPAGTSGTLITLRFVVNCCSGGTPWVYLCPDLPTGDLASLGISCGEWYCVPVSTHPSTWGRVKALYREP